MPDMENNTLAQDALTILNALPGCYLVLLPDAPRFTIVGATEAYLATTYTKREEVMGQGVFESLTDDPQNPEATGVKNLRASLLTVLEQKKEHRMADQRYDVFNPASGHFERKIWSPLNRPVLDAAGRVQYIIHTVEDVTERVRLQEAERATYHKLLESEANFRNMVLQAPVAMAILYGPSFTLEVANARMYELWGKEPAALLGKAIFEALPEVGDRELEELLQQVYATGKRVQVFERPVLLPRKHKAETSFINFVYEPFKSSSGTIIGVIVVAIDVTGQVNARLEMEKGHKELQFVLDVMPQMVWRTDAQGNADFFNQVYVDYTGLPMSQLTGQQWTALLHPDDRVTSSSVWLKALEEGDNGYVMEHRLRGRDGTYRWFLSRGVPLKDAQGRIVKWYGTTTDIEEQKKAARLLEQHVAERTHDLQEANARLHRLNTELEQFTYVSHHDLQEPLRKIVLFSDLVKKESYDQLPETAQKRFDKVTHAARRMSVVLRDVLNFARLSMEEQRVAVDLDDVLATVLVDLELVISDSGAEIRSDALPTIQAVRGQMHQLLFNLVNNALKFLKPGTHPQVTITSRRAEAADLARHPEAADLARHPEVDPSVPYYEIAVRDNGIGFPKEAADKIFMLFQRLHSKDVYEGTGIGLALCKKVVANHGGAIWAESAPGEGAVFKVLLPAG